jgi:N-methylhydantoinase B
VLRLEAGDVVEFRTAGGGGFGDPYEREPERVAADVAAGLLDASQAEQDYGVVLDDDAATAARRAGAREAALFDLGPEREAYELRLGDEVFDEIVRLLEPVPSRLRPLLRDRLRRDFDRSDGAVSPDDVPAALGRAARELGLGRLEPLASGGSR